MSVTRREFVGGALGLGAASLLWGCGSDSKQKASSSSGAATSSSVANSSAAVTTSGVVTTSGGAAKDSIKVGLLSELTGPFALFGTNMSRSVRLAVDQINKEGGILGRQLQVIEEDTQTDVSVAVDKARKLVRSDKVDVVFGPAGSDENDAVFREVAQQGKTLYLYSEGYEGNKCDPLYFAFGTVPSQQTELFLPFLQDQFGPKALLFGADFVWPHRSFELAKKTIQANHGEVVGEIYLPIVSDDFSSLINEVRDKKPDYIYALYPAVFGAALKALVDANLYKGIGIGDAFVGDPDLAGMGSLADGLLSTLSFSQAIDTPPAKKFLSDFQAAYGKNELPTGNECVTSYNAALMYKAAAEKAGTVESAKVAAAMVGTSIDGPIGKVEMTNSHHVKQSVSVFRAKGGVYEFVKSFPDLEPREPVCT